MKKLIAMLLAVVMVLGLCACGSDKPDSEPTATEPAAIEPAATEPAATEPAATEPAATEPAATEPAATEPADPYNGDPNANVSYFFPIPNKIEVTVGSNTHVLSTDNDIVYTSDDLSTYTTYTTDDLSGAFGFGWMDYRNPAPMIITVHSSYKVTRLELFIYNHEATAESYLAGFLNTDVMVASVDYDTPTDEVSIPMSVCDPANNKYDITAANLVFENGDIVTAYYIDFGA